ncbi:hypothetical protein GQ600_18336 [Phytophthora cactorum]|nr:hypothetical protein GQ600_18336 [Phytophthora cactorum]
MTPALTRILVTVALVVLALTPPADGEGGGGVGYYSAFSYAKTLVQLEGLWGLYCMGMLKTTSREYPRQYMKDWVSTGPACCSFKCFRAKLQRVSQCTRSVGPTASPNASFRSSPPLTCTTILDKDALKWSEHGTPNNSLDSSIADFNSFISHQLIVNDFAVQRSTRLGSGTDLPGAESLPTHTLRSFSSLAQYPRLSGTALRAQRKCGVCSKKASLAVLAAQTHSKKHFFGVCVLQTNRDCHSMHSHSA